jgi:4-diphosphocytidyl-2-C-methyl-D-erythritol kinase
VSSKSTTVRVPAKINLQLAVGPLLPTGYHELATVFQAISLFDEINVKAEIDDNENKKLSVDLSARGTFANGVPLDESNLAIKAAQLFFERTNIPKPTKLRIEIKKEIPIAGGLAGGSADAAGVLLALDNIFSTGLSKAELEDLAAEIGSDVPFILSGGVAIGRGRGEELTSVLTRGTYHWVLAIAHQGLSTPVVYAECDRLREGMEIASPPVNNNLISALAIGDSRALGENLSNDLQSAAISLKPALKLILDVGKENGALGGLVSGSGPTVAFLVEDENQAIELSVALTSSQVVAGVVRATGPVHGAVVI